MKQKSKYIIVLILLLGIGFSTISASLFLGGNTKFTKNETDFDVRFTKAVLGENDITDTAIIENGTKITYSTGGLNLIGEKSVLKFNITNNSNLYDAEVSLSCTNIEHTDYLNMSVDIDGDTTTIIKAKKTKKGTITVNLKKSTTEDISENFTCTLNVSAKEKNILGTDESASFVSAYTYNQTSGAANYCVTGEEETCQATTCYKTKEEGSCPAGTIIKYIVNDVDTETFHVMYDDASTITMQAQRNTVYNTAWHAGKNEISYGPDTVLSALEAATASWSNVEEQTYTMGTTTFKTNAYTGCDFASCSENKYTLGQRTGKARMITIQETALLGCNSLTESCPKWMNNYLQESTSYGGIVNDNPNSDNYGYWTMSAYSSSDSYVWCVSRFGNVTSSSTCSTNIGARAVVVVSKE